MSNIKESCYFDELTHLVVVPIHVALEDVYGFAEYYLNGLTNVERCSDTIEGHYREYISKTRKLNKQ